MRKTLVNYHFSTRKIIVSRVHPPLFLLSQERDDICRPVEIQRRGSLWKRGSEDYRNLVYHRIPLHLLP